MSCYAQDVHGCLRMLKRGRPIFTQFFDQQYVYIGASVSSREILNAFQQHSWMDTKEQIHLQEQHLDIQKYLSTLDRQESNLESESTVAQEMQRLCNNQTSNPFVSKRHLLTNLPDARCKIPKH